MRRMRSNRYTVGSCLVASSGALLFGLDVGITGGVIGMPSFLEKFFPDIYSLQLDHATTNGYCSFDSQLLSLFTSSFFLSGMFSSLVASWVTEQYGRKASMAAGAVLYLVGSTMNAAAADTAMLIAGRIILGLGCGFANQAVPIFLSEIPHPEHRGSLQTCFQINVNIGILVAGIVNYYTSRVDFGWRISLGVFIPPALIILAGAIFLPESPSFLYSSGRTGEARDTLQKLRGTSYDIEEEFELIELDAKQAKKYGGPSQQLRTIMSHKHRGELTVACLVAVFSQLTGINSMLYYTPELFSSVGVGDGLFEAVIVAIVLLAGAVTSFFAIDRIGRRPLLVSGGAILFVFQLATALVLKFNFNPLSDAMSSASADALLATICLFTYTFGWSWGPLGWLVPVESQSHATRSAGSTMSTVTNFFAVFLTTQFFLPMLCTMQWGIFVLYAVFDVVMALFAWLLLVETKGVPIEQMHEQFGAHWFWKRYATNDQNNADFNDTAAHLLENDTVSYETL